MKYSFDSFEVTLQICDLNNKRINCYDFYNNFLKQANNKLINDKLSRLFRISTFLNHPLSNFKIYGLFSKLNKLNAYGEKMGLDFKMKCICNSTEFNEISKYSTSIGEKVKYKECKSCGLIIVPESVSYDLSKIYNENYFLNTDTGWKERAEFVLQFVNILNNGLNLKKMKICDFGAGNGYLAKSLIDSGYNVFAYEPFIGNNLFLDKKYYVDEAFEAEVLLMVEVFEHFTNSLEEIEEILEKFSSPKFIILTTKLRDNVKENIDNWWYLNPDAGHFTIWSKKSLALLGDLEGYSLVSFSDSMHVLCKKENKKKIEVLKLQSIAYRFKNAVFSRYISLKNNIKI